MPKFTAVLNDNEPNTRRIVFSYSMGNTWIAFSWLFDLLVYPPYALCGLSGVVYFVVAMALLITFAAHQLVRRTDCLSRPRSYWLHWAVLASDR